MLIDSSYSLNPEANTSIATKSDNVVGVRGIQKHDCDPALGSDEDRHMGSGERDSLDSRLDVFCCSNLFRASGTATEDCGGAFICWLLMGCMSSRDERG